MQIQRTDRVSSSGGVGGSFPPKHPQKRERKEREKGEREREREREKDAEVSSMLLP